MLFIEVDKRAIKDVIAELNAGLSADGIEAGEHLFTDMSRHDDGPTIIENYRWLVCYPVRGGSEGYYVHLALLIDTPGAAAREHRLIGLAKTYAVDNAWEIAKAAARLLDL
jgi:hypothetical protein